MYAACPTLQLQLAQHCRKNQIYNPDSCHCTRCCCMRGSDSKQCQLCSTCTAYLLLLLLPLEAVMSSDITLHNTCLWF